MSTHILQDDPLPAFTPPVDTEVKITERDMLDALTARYTSRRPGAIADRYVRAEHVRSTQNGWRELVSVADFIAIDKWPSSQAMHGHEVKVSRADWLTELKNPEKANRVKRFCHYWWLVVPTASIVRDGELPEGWGLLTLTSAGLRAKVKAPPLAPEPMTLDFTAGLAAAVQRTAMREPLRRDAETATIWNASDDRGRDVCAACGEASPCAAHQPRLTERSTT